MWIVYFLSLVSFVSFLTSNDSFSKIESFSLDKIAIKHIFGDLRLVPLLENGENDWG